MYIHVLYNVHRHVHTCLYNVHTCMYMYINLTCCAWQANTRSSTGCLRLDINLLKPTRIKFVEQPAPSLSLPDGTHSPSKW